MVTSTYERRLSAATEAHRSASIRSPPESASKSPSRDNALSAGSAGPFSSQMRVYISSQAIRRQPYLFAHESQIILNITLEYRSSPSAAAAPEIEASQSCCTAPHKQTACHSAFCILTAMTSHSSISSATFSRYGRTHCCCQPSLEASQQPYRDQCPSMPSSPPSNTSL
jgi:hypothetical protein